MPRIPALLIAAALWPACAPAQNAREVLRSVEETPGLPRLLLIGDSISMGYTEPVRKLLAGKFTVQRIAENGGPTSRGVTNLEKWLGSGKWDVIHFNFGLHDLRIMEDTGRQQAPPADYAANLRQIVARLKQTGARLIWASTTPVPAGKLTPERRPADVVAYNEAAARVMQENGIEVDDLYGFALPQLEKIQRPANVHFTDPGSAVLAEQVVRSISGK
jgi:lysophospholipase L1-like esterase